MRYREMRFCTISCGGRIENTVKRCMYGLCLVVCAALCVAIFGTDLFRLRRNGARRNGRERFSVKWRFADTGQFHMSKRKMVGSSDHEPDFARAAGASEWHGR